MSGRRRALIALLAGVGGASVFLLRGRGEPPAPDAWMARAGVVPRFEDADGIRLHYVRRGRGPAVVLLHGFASSVYSWSEVLPALAERHDVVALDFPCFGRSEVRPGLSAESYVRLVPAFLDRLGLARAALVGHSLGGAVAGAVAARYPERVERLVLIDSAGFNLAPADRPWLLRLAGAAPPAPLIGPLRRPLVVMGLKQVFHDDARVTPERVEEYLAPLGRPGAMAAMQSVLASAGGAGLPEALGRVRAPTLVVWGRQDAWVPLEQADRFLSSIPGARKVVIEGCGHIPQEERPQELARVVEEFLSP